MPFNGINNLRDSTESVEMEPWMLQELAKCARDPLYFIKNYVYINTKDHGMQLFNLYDFQSNLIKKFNKYRFNIVKFPRQSGKCLFYNEIVRIKTEDGAEKDIKIGDLHKMLKNNYKEKNENNN